MADPSWIDLVLARATELRAAGVLSIGPDSATFAPYEAPAPSVDNAPTVSTEETYDPLHDPASYVGGVVPGYRIERYEEPDE